MKRRDLSAKTIVAFICIALFNTVFAAPRSASKIMEQKILQKGFYVLNTGVYDALVINMAFGQTEVVSKLDIQKLKEADVFQVDLVYSDYPKGQDLTELNLSRIKVVQRLRNDLVTDADVNWRIIKQTRCSNEAEAKTLFHGVVIHYRSKQSKDVSVKDLSFINGHFPKEDMTVKEAAQLRTKLRDSTIFKVFERKKKWTDMLIVSDLTESMSPYTTQLILWFKLKMNDHRIKDVVFFNDGDNTPDNKKVIGKTGGIYHAKATTFEEVKNTAILTVSKGYGGDGPENDFEALLYGIKISPKAKEIILIADNNSTVKDYELLSKIDKPIRVILCGSEYYTNPQYLNLALKTGGSVHTMKEDLENLMELNEGEGVRFNGRAFVIKNGEFIEIKKT